MAFAIVSLAMVLVLGSRAHRARVVRRFDAAYAARFEAGSEGIADGAQPFTLHAAGTRALLLLHGSGDTPQTMRYLGERLHRAGFTVHAPLLPGHGRSPSAFAGADVDASRYLATATAGLDLLRREATWLGVVGLSMGGALAVQLAADADDVRALVLLAPYLDPPPMVRWVARTAWLWGAIAPVLDARGEGSVQDEAARTESRAYGIVSPPAMRALVRSAEAGRRALGRVTVPALVIHSREDIRIPTHVAERMTASLAGPTERHWVAGCGHIITVDRCRAEVAGLVLAFLSRVAPG